MKTTKMKFMSLLLALLLLVMVTTPTTSIAAEAPVTLGTTEDYAVLAGSTITNIGTTTINGSFGGNVGLYPGTSFTGQETITISGEVHVADTQAMKAKEDLVVAYNDAAGRLPVTRIPSELGGTTLTPGVYDSADGTFQITGTLTLDAQGDPEGVFVFKTASSLTTASNSNVNMINSARFCRTFWKVASSATLGSNSYFVGHILAQVSITANTGAAVQGQLLAITGAVTLDSNTITNGICEVIVTLPPTEVIPEPAILYVIKHVINDDGRTAIATDFNLYVKTSGNDVVASPAPGAEAPGTVYGLDPGTYVISEDAIDGYTLSYSGDSDSDGTITLAAGDVKTVTLTNNDTLPAEMPDINGEGTPDVIEDVIEDDIEVVTETVTGGELPKTGAQLNTLFIIGVVLVLVGAVGWIYRKRFE
ncbi:MAG: hypothetical protein CVU84_07710 [Firmicutes bacterium HGW-Firmicutes-1]|jgi:LPXTG-motif cell wall-anchored protein|nr:MAG: hypothetical protein CVU84_07710 [Firmicutes bacterium HGW-Firmicutes-1]